MTGQTTSAEAAMLEQGKDMARPQDHLKLAIGLKCHEIAEEVFYHFLDRGRRDKLAAALFDLAQLLSDSDGGPKGEGGTASPETTARDEGIAHD